METLSTQSTGDKITLVAKRPTEVAHLLENEPWIIKTTSDGVRIVASFVVFPLVVLHHLLPALVFQIIWVED